MYDINYGYLKKNKVYNYLINKNYKIVWKYKYSFIFEKTKLLEEVNEKKN